MASLVRTASHLQEPRQEPKESKCRSRNSTRKNEQADTITLGLRSGLPPHFRYIIYFFLCDYLKKSYAVERKRMNIFTLRNILFYQVHTDDTKVLLI